MKLQPKDNAGSQGGQGQTPFGRFQDALKQVLSVPKKDLDLKSSPKKPKDKSSKS